MTSIDFQLDFFHHEHYENLSTTTTNLTTTIISDNKNELNWPVLSLSVLAVCGVLGNSLVCVAISLDKQLQTVTNWFLFSLAIADFLVSLIVLPLSIIKDFHGSWLLPIAVCDLFIFLDVLLCTTSIWHLTILSIDRFLHISRPFRSRERSKRKTFLTILGIWTFSIAISCIILILGFTDKSNIIVVDNNRQHCVLNNRSFIIYGSIICFCIPCILMLVTYSLTVHRLHVEGAKCYSDPDDNLMIKPRKNDGLRRHMSTTKRNSNSSSQTSKNTPSKDISPSTPTSLSPPQSTDRNDKQNYLQKPVSPTTSIPPLNTQQRSFLNNTFVQKAVHAFKGGTETSSERRAMKVLGIVFFVFLVAWLPFSILNILSAACPTCGVQPSLLNLTSWFGLISSNLNPLIYTAFNVRFRRAFVSILTCRSNYFSQKRKGNNHYVFIANNNNQKILVDHEQYFFPSRRFISQRRLKPKNFN
ncbi:unnamed protein product [Adineta steineri]|uniref:G-protein coupled receptors family 1 profile domain-containing protein n=1 Tax=Adineta steineri TaxID=433720 RepID=A0A815PGB5_9BILA|nr:unnamed protein product [Adineta steineri]CAF3917963.1 unnamed protein product [Adineta steineri]